MRRDKALEGIANFKSFVTEGKFDSPSAQFAQQQHNALAEWLQYSNEIHECATRVKSITTAHQAKYWDVYHHPDIDSSFA